MKRVALLFVPLIAIPLLASCNNEKTYTITWKNWDGTVLETDENVKKGTLPQFDGPTPTKPDDDSYRYTFDGWDPAIKEVTESTTYVATYKKVEIDATTVKVSFPEYASSYAFEFYCEHGDNFKVNWGDGSVVDKNLTHTYTAPGDYEIKIYNANNLSFSLLSGSVYITEAHLGNSLTSVDPFAFTYCISLEKVSLPNTITSIGEGAFTYCPYLHDINFPNSLTLIDSGAFAACTSLERITLPNTITSIGRSAFTDCYYLSEINLPTSLTLIDSFTFAHCYSFTTIDIPEGITSIGEEAFTDCSYLTNINLPNTIEYVATTAFDGCNNLQYNEDNYARYLGNKINKYLVMVDVLDEESATTSYDVKDGCRVILNSAFGFCKNLTNVAIPNSIVYIGEYAFNGCKNLKYEDDGYACYLGNATNDYLVLVKAKNKQSITATCRIKAGCKLVLDKAFDGCENLNSVTITNDVIFISKTAFNNCKSLATIKVEDGNKVYDSRGECNAIIETKTNSLVAGCNNTEIPDDVVSIGDYAFSGSGIASITIPKNIISIGYYAFRSCFSLSEVKFSDNSSLKKIGDVSFCSCSNLATIDIPDSVETIGLSAFKMCINLVTVNILPTSSLTKVGNGAFMATKIASIYIPSKVESIDQDAFTSCSSLQTVNLKALRAVPYLGLDAFSNCDEALKLYVDETMIDKFKKDYYWSTYADKITDEEIPQHYIG